MSTNEKPLFTLTVEEYQELNRKMFQEFELEILSKVKNTKEPQKLEKDIIFLKEVLELTGYKPSTVYSKVCRFEIPVISKRKPLTFSRKAIMEWMEAGKPSVIDTVSTNYLNS